MLCNDDVCNAIAQGVLKALRSRRRPCPVRGQRWRACQAYCHKSEN
jgi:hypothetical protein